MATNFKTNKVNKVNVNNKRSAVLFGSKNVKV